MMQENNRKRYSLFAKSMVMGTQMASCILMAVSAVVLNEYIHQYVFDMDPVYELYAWSRQSFGMLLTGAALWIFCLCYMTVAAGKGTKDNDVHLTRFDRLPTELPVGILVCVLFLILILAMKIHRQDYQMLGRMIMAGTFMLLADLCFMGMYLGIVRRVKADMFWENSLIVKGFSGLRYRMNRSHHQHMGSQKKKLLEGLERITQGDLEYKLDVHEFSGTDLQLAEGINHIGEDLAQVISERVQDERMKANMITNISHDLKTPLTSIINYIGLLQRENIANPAVNNYINVLEQKAMRLKQLMEDLTEVSRISSGNVTLQMAVIDMVELVCQTGGEFNEKLEQKGLNVITKLPREEAKIYADGRQLWRVIGNLYNNVTKYAMPNTRVYVEVGTEEDQIFFSMKNITQNPLTVNADMLTERFVRGDESRSTEGSGLGLSISKMLTELMGGRFELSMEDDLFRVKVMFRRENGS